MKRRIFRSMCITSFLSILLSVLLVVGVVYKEQYAIMQQAVRRQAELAAATLNLSGEAVLDLLQPGSDRITLIAQDGTVLYDSFENPTTMENHGNRPEVKTALHNGTGRAHRLSQTLDASTFYYAIRLDNNMVVRVSTASKSVLAAMAGFLPWILLIGFLLSLFFALFSRMQTDKLIAPINRIDLEDPLSNDVYAELSPLLRRISAQNDQLHAQMRQLEEQQRELQAITENMSEGLIVLSPTARILSVNKSAVNMLGKQGEIYTGRNILALNRSLLLQQAVEGALEGESSEKILTLDGRHFQLLANPVWQNETLGGVLLLLLDVTEKQQAEQLRREFTANVSHELKTPLTSISGYAEILKEGLVQPEDVPTFSSRIYNETKRLIALVEDILELSHLDEKNRQLPIEPVDMFVLAKQVRDRLLERAQEAEVKLSVHGESATVSGAPSILDEILYNLSENAIKYNRKGGRVDLTIQPEAEQVVLTVADTGIGIPLEYQSRVFERFFRVDKSHSRDTGGTGLGLSIVKHGVQYHNGSIDLQSSDGKGTTIRIVLPRSFE